MNEQTKTQRVEIHGVSVTQINYKGRWYTGVDSRVKIAEQADPAKVRHEGAGYHVVSVQFVEIGERWAYHCMVEYPAGSGVIKPGTDFIDTKDPSGVAKAETSAIGRALGLHGIAIEESIASAEEMSGMEDEEQQTPSQQSPRGKLIEMDLQQAPAHEQKELARVIRGQYTSLSEVEGFLRSVTGRSISGARLKTGESEINRAEVRKVLQALGLGEPVEA